jgi:UDP-N-acetylmuramyl pentapeptide synthase
MTLEKLISLIKPSNVTNVQALGNDTIDISRLEFDSEKSDFCTLFVAARIHESTPHNDRWYPAKTRTDEFWINYHDDIAGAYRCGCRAFLCEYIPHGSFEGATFIIVNSVVEALAQLSRVLIELLGITTIGITGSSGKTSVAHVMEQVLCNAGITARKVFTRRPNPISFPKQITSVILQTPGVKALVLEYSIDHVGNMEALLKIAPAMIGVFLNVRDAHLNFFHTQDAIAREKAVLIRSLPKVGASVLNADDVLVMTHAKNLHPNTLTYSTAELSANDPNLRVCVSMIQPFSTRLQIHHGEDLAEAQVQFVGDTVAEIFAPIVGVALTLGVSTQTIAQSLGDAHAMPGRMSWHKHTSTGVRVFNNCSKMAPSNFAHLASIISSTATMWRSRKTLILASIESPETPSPERSCFEKVLAEFDQCFLVDYPELNWATASPTVRVAKLENVLDILRDLCNNGLPDDVICLIGSEYSKLSKSVEPVLNDMQS